MVSTTARGGRLHMPQAGTQIAVALTIGVLQPPVVWIAGREPPPPPVVPPRPRCGPRRQRGNAPTSVVVSSCYRAGLFALCGKKGCGESVTHRLCSWTSVRCCEPPMKSSRRSKRNSCQCHCMRSAKASTPLWAACMTPSLRAGKNGALRACAKGHSGRRAIGQTVLIGIFRRRLARELLEISFESEMAKARQFLPFEKVSSIVLGLLNVAHS